MDKNISKSLQGKPKTDAFHALSYGLYLITAGNEERRNGYIANSAIQVSAFPPKFVVCSNKENYTTGIIKECGAYSISVLSRDTPVELIRKFGYQSGADIDKFEGFNLRKGETGIPIWKAYTIATFECKVEQTVDAGTHLMFIGELVNYDFLDEDAMPLTYAWYREQMKGFSPEKAPTYVETEPHPEIFVKTDDGKYICSICGYIYDPVKGDPDRGIDPGTPFEEVAEDWTCPVCGAAKIKFVLT